jgi:hypothetical protein
LPTVGGRRITAMRRRRVAMITLTAGEGQQSINAVARMLLW